MAEAPCYATSRRVAKRQETSPITADEFSALRLGIACLGWRQWQRQVCSFDMMLRHLAPRPEATS